LSFEKAKTLFPFLSEPALKPYIPKLRPQFNAGGLRGNKLEIIKAKVSVVVELEAAGVKRWRRGGTSIAACCPFHHDMHPSLWAKPDKGIWGCNVSGCPAYGTHDVVNARAMRLGLTLPEAIRELWAEVRP
jgi:diadenosine tetraphosphatase ApaH/serine/threonine PP2A family protein phosphatase